MTRPAKLLLEPRQLWRIRAQNAVLLLLLLASGGMAWNAIAEHRSAEQRAQEVAQQTAAEATGSLIRLARTAELTMVYRAMAPITGELDEDTPSIRHRFALLATHPQTETWCSRFDVVCDHGVAQYVFHIDLRTGVFTSGAPVDPQVRRWIRDSISYEAIHAYRRGWQIAALDARVAGMAHVIMYRVSFGPHDVAATANGFEVDIPLTARQAFTHAFNDAPLLTTPATQGLPNDSLFTVVVRDADGRLLFRAGSDAGATNAVEMKGEPTWYLGPYTARLQLTPRFRAAFDAAAGRTRTVATTVLLLISCIVLTMVGILHSRREYALARLRDSFIGNISHELRMPLAQIRLQSDALRFGFLRDPKARDGALDVISDEAIRLRQLVDNLLTYTQDSVGELALHSGPVDVAALALDVLRRLEPIGTRAGVALEARATGAAMARADQRALEQVIANLVDNAIRYAAGSGCITVQVEQLGSVVRIAVQDRGPGIAEHDKQRIWRRFTRLDAAKDVPGTGIGLALVASLVGAMGGRAWVTDTVPQGATFIVEVPAADLFTLHSHDNHDTVRNINTQVNKRRRYP